MRQLRGQEAVLWLVGIAGVILLAVAQATLFYRTSPAIGIGVPVGLGLAALVLARPQVGVLVGIAAVPLEIARSGVGSFSLSPMEVMLLMAAGCIAVRWAVGATQLRIDPVFLAFGAGLVWILAGLGGARDDFVVVRTVIMWSAFGLVALWVGNANPRQVRQVLYVIVLAAAANAAIALLTGTDQVARQGATAVEGRAQGAFTHPNQLAFFLVMALPPALVMAMRGHRVLRAACAVGVVLIFAALALTLTRGAIIGAAVSLAIMLWWPPFRRMAGVALVCLLVFAAANSDSLSRSKELSLVGARLATVLDRDSAAVNNGRLQIWERVPDIVADHPVFGLSVGNFSRYSLEYGLSEGGVGFQHAHNVPLTVASEQGLPGLALLLLTIVLVLRHAAEAMRSRASELFPYALAVIAGLGGLFVNSLTDYPPGSNPDMALIMVEIGVLTAVVRQLRRAQP